MEVVKKRSASRKRSWCRIKPQRADSEERGAIRKKKKGIALSRAPGVDGQKGLWGSAVRGRSGGDEEVG